MPDDVASAFIQLEWGGIEIHYEVSQPTVRRWMRQAGEHDLIERRRGYLRKLYASRGLTSIMGRRCAAKHGGFPEMAREDPARDWLPINRNRRPFRGRLSALVPIDGDDDDELIVPSRAGLYVLGRTGLAL